MKTMKIFAAVALVVVMAFLAGCDCSTCDKPAPKAACNTPVCAKPAANCSTCLFTPEFPAVLTAETPYPASVEGTYVPVVVVSKAVTADSAPAAN